MLYDPWNWRIKAFFTTLNIFNLKILKILTRAEKREKEGERERERGGEREREREREREKERGE